MTPEPRVSCRAVLLTALLPLLVVAGGKPVMRIPKMATPPTIDGKLGEAEWAGASAVTGFTVGVGDYHPDQYPADMRGVWYLGYDDRHLYLAMHTPVPEAVTLNAQTKDPGDMDNVNAVIFGDHIEVRISPHSAARAKQTGFGHYLFCVNPFDIWSDSWECCDEPGNETAWNSGAKVKSTFDNNNWWLEMAIPLTDTMKSVDGGRIKETDDLELILHLVRAGFCGGWSWSAWTPATFNHWDRFYTVVLDPDAPVMQFRETGDLILGDMDLQLRLRGAGPATVSVNVVDIAGETLVEERRQLTLGDQWQTANFKQELALPPWQDSPELRDKRNVLTLEVEAAGEVVYRSTMGFARQTPDRRERTYVSYLRGLPKGEYKSKIAYIARNGKCRVEVVTDVIGDLPEAIRQAPAFRLRVAPVGGGKPILDRKLPITQGVGSHLLELGELQGEYLATIDLLAAGDQVVDSREHRFVRVKHEWEDNSIGEEPVVIPPFRPIEVRGDVLKTRLATFRAGPGGLWQGVAVRDRQLVTAPLELRATVAGETAAWQGGAPGIEKVPGRAFPPEFDQYRFLVRDCPEIPFDQLPETDAYAVRIAGQGRTGPVAVKVDATLEYDGYTRYRIQYGPADGPVKIDRLELPIELFGEINTMYITREVGAGGHFTLPAERQGLLWESASLAGRHPRFKGTFVPLIHLGDGHYGFQFRAASDEGWLLDDDSSCMRLERHGDRMLLRLLLVNAPATLDRDRTVEFALMPLPAKPAPPNARYHMWGGMDRDYCHHAFGWRKYGTGADNWYLPDDEAYIRLGEFIRTGKTGKDPELAATKPIMMYTSPLAIGAPLPDCDSFKGQWWQNSEYDPGHGASVRWGGKGTDPTGTYVWDQPECFTEARPQGWDDDLNDNYMYYHQKLTALGQTNGTYWDNAEIQHNLNLDAGTYGYIRDDGHAQPTNNVDQRRRLMKRLYTMGWLAGKPPLHNSKFPFQAPFHTLNFMWEGPWYLYTERSTWYDAHAPNRMAQLRLFRDSLETPAMINSKMPGIRDRNYDQRAPRSYMALAILHDIGLRAVRADNSAIIRKLDEQLGFLNREQQAEFIPYWQSADLVSFVEWKEMRGGRETWTAWQPEGLYVSVYRSRTEPRRALLWFVNISDQMAITGLRVDCQALVGANREAVIIRHLETDVQMGKHLPKSVTKPRDQQTLWRNITVPPRSFLPLIVEVGEYVAPPYPNEWP